MGRLQVKAKECKHKEYGRRLKEQFMNGMNNEATTAKITKELAALKDTTEVSSEEVLVWDQRVETQRAL